MEKIIYVPLDERACNYKFPAILASLTDNIKLLVPPVELMGMKKKPADYDKIWEWIFKNAPDCSYAILSVDTLVYGNIINSRTHHRTKDECAKTLSNFRRLKEENPRIKIHAFNLAARVAAYNSSAEDPDYWGDYGRDIWRYTYLYDKIRRGLAQKEERDEFQSLERSIPGEFLDDFMKRREVDRFTNLSCVELVSESVIEMLTIPKDDTAEYGYAAMDQAAISKKVAQLGLMNRVLVYPGADEVGCVIFARIFNLIKHYTPKIYVRYSSTLGPFVVPLYEDRPLAESIKSQITSVGGVQEDHADQSDCLLAVNSPGQKMIESGEQREKDVTFSSYINLDEFMRYIPYYSEHYRRAVGLAEVSVANGCENECMDYALMAGVYQKIQSVGGWNTAQNTIGLVLAHTVIASYYNRFDALPEKKKKSQEFMMTCLVTDWLYQSNVLYRFLLQEKGHIDPYNLGSHYDRTVIYFSREISKLMNEKFPFGFEGNQMEIRNLRFNWDGVFYIDFDVCFV